MSEWHDGRSSVPVAPSLSGRSVVVCPIAATVFPDEVSHFGAMPEKPGFRNG